MKLIETETDPSKEKRWIFDWMFLLPPGGQKSVTAKQ